jgi:hypothetical protein
MAQLKSAIFARIKPLVFGPDRPQKAAMEPLQLAQLPFLTSLCWQGENPSLAHLTELEILNLYERNWPLRGVMADTSEPETTFIRRIAVEYHSWLVNEV